jgi:hypothetical protein
MWLITATSMSITGNVTHAVLHAAVGTVGLAAGAALVPPVVLLASTHSLAVLVRTRASGFTYWCALMMTVALAACAFVLSFDALRSLAITLGLPPAIAWLWPCAIDVAIAQATLCLLSLSRRGVAGGPAVAAQILGRAAGDTSLASERVVASSQAAVAPHAAIIDAGGGGEARKRNGAPSRLAPPVAAAFATDIGDADALQRWKPIAESIVQEGITSKDSGLVATILAQREAGVPPSTIGRTCKVHHTTVGRILSAAEALTA